MVNLPDDQAELLQALFQNYLAETKDDDITFNEFVQEVFLEMQPDEIAA